MLERWISIRRRWKRLAEEILLMLILIMSNNFIFLPATAYPINNGSVFSSPFPLNGSVGVSVDLSSVNVTICDPKGDRFDWSIETYPDVGSNFSNATENGSKICMLSGLAYSTTYVWFVNATDGEDWTREYFLFTTEDAPIENPSKGGGSGGGGQPQNNPPETPTKPSGPTFIEMGVEYLFSSISTDMNGDLIRYQSDWGDGTKSEWSEFIPSNTQVSMPHFWNSIATYEVKILAQDDNERYSGWSKSLEVVVSQVEEGNIPSVAVINFSRDDINDHTIEFDAYDSFTPHGNITDYLWDFGDGEHGNGIQIVHTYKKPGTYNVTLVVKDNKSNPLCNSSIHIAVRSQVEKQSEIKQAIYFFIFVIGVVVLGLFIVFSETFKNDVSYFSALNLSRDV